MNQAFKIFSKSDDFETIYFYSIVEAVFNKVLRLKQRQRGENFWSATFGLPNSSFDPIYKECPLTL